LDTLQKEESGTIPLSIYQVNKLPCISWEFTIYLLQCQGGGSSAQVFSLSKNGGQLRREISCAVADAGTKQVQLTACMPELKNQQWELTKVYRKTLEKNELSLFLSRKV
jgi:hypothetical protein